MGNETAEQNTANFLKLGTDDPESVIIGGESLLDSLSVEEQPDLRAEVLYRIGLARINRGEFESAFRSLSEARHLHDELLLEKESLKDQLAFGVIYSLSEQPEAAFETFLGIRDRAGDIACPELEAVADIRMGRICFDQQRFEEGLGFINTALKILETAGIDGHRGEALIERGRILMHQGRLEEAAADLEEVLERRRTVNRMDYRLDICLGDLYIRSGRFDEAGEILEKALEYCREYRIPHGEIMALFHMGKLRKATGDPESAINYWKDCYGMTDSSVIRQMKIKSGEKLAASFRDSGDTATALEYLEDIRRTESLVRNERLHHTISVYDQSMRIDDLEQEMRSWRRRSGELEKIRNDREEAIREMKTITLIGEKITASLDPDTIVSMLYDSLSELVMVHGMTIAFYDEKSSSLDIRYIIEDGKAGEPVIMPIRQDESITSWVVSNNRDLLINSREEALRYTKAISRVKGTSYLSESFLIVRLRIEGSIIGVMSVQSREPGSYRESHLQVLQALASFIAIAMTNSSAHQRLVTANEKIAHMATHDPLTGLPNRMQILNRLGNELERCKRYNGSVAVLFIDLDGFKEINDSFGHRAGDEVLKVIAGRLHSGIRSTDAVGRLAGDEFLVILTDDCTPGKGRVLAEHILENLARPIEFDDRELGVTASIGLATCPIDADGPGDLVNAADQAMYDAKAAGKNKICIHREEK